MKIEKEQMQLLANGKVEQTAYLNRGYQRGIFYFEHSGIAAELAEGKTKQRAKVEAIKREAVTLFNAAIGCIKEMGQLDSAEADSLINEIYESFSSAVEQKAGAGVKLEALIDHAAALFFAERDAAYTVLKRDPDTAELLQALCFEVDEEQVNGEIPVNARVREVRRRLKAMQAEADKAAAQELSQEGRAIYDRLTALDAALTDLDPEEAEKRQEEAEAALDALALEDPEEATRIYQRCPYFEIAEGFSKYEVYLGRGTFCKRNELAQLDTPEKRAAFVIYGTLPGEADNGTAEQPGPISGGAAPADGEPVTLDGCGEPAAIE